ncbi:hypothetical protein [Serratia symbiotica]|uniref:hypothetical protein n=1 Tax=Serratia symbiotica TaxID=138074 RepID=UPI003CC87F1B
MDSGLEPGICWHLFAKEQAERAAEQASPEILHNDLASFWHELLQWGCHDAAQWTWLDWPPAAALASAKVLLRQLVGATNDSDKLTAQGRQMAALGCEPRLAAMLTAWAMLGADGLATAAALAALLEEQPRSGQKDIGYWLSHPKPHWQRRAGQFSRRFSQRPGQLDMSLAARLLAHGFADRIDQRRGKDDRYLLANGIGAAMDLDEALSRASWLIIPRLLHSDNSPDARLMFALPVKVEALVAQLPAIVSQQTTVAWDEEKGRLRAWKRQQIGSLTLCAQLLAKPADEALQQALIDWVRAQGLAVLHWDTAANS